MALFSNQDIYKTYQDLLGQGMTYDQIVAAAQRNPNLNLSAEQINAALAEYQKPKVTDDQLLQAGRTALQQGLDPQSALQRAAEFGASQDQLGRLNQALGTSGITGLTTPTSTLDYTAPAATNIPGAPAPYSLSTPNITNEDILQAGRTRLQAGADPQSLLNELAANPSASQEQIQSAYNALSSSGYSGLTMPGAKSTTMPVTSRATADTGMTGAGTTGAATTGAATAGATTGAVTGALPAQGATLTDQLLNAFTQGQQTGNYGTFQSLLRQSKASASDIAAMFPQLSEQNVMDFAKQYGLSLEAPSRVNLVGSMRDVPAEAASSLNLAKQLVTSMGPGYESLLSDPKLLQQMREAAPADYRQLLLGGFNAAQRTGDFTKFNKMLADRDVSETELRTMFPNITNAAIDEFKKRGLKFSALPDWMENQNLIKDQSVAEQIASKWKQEYGRDISPDDLKIVASQIGSMPSQADAKTVIGNIKNTPLLKSQEFLNAQKRGETFIPGLLTLQQAGLADLVGGFEGGQPARYDWNAIANSKDPRGAIIASNRQLAAMSDQTLAKDYPQYAKIVGTVSGIPLVQRQTQKGDTYLTLGGASITDPKSLSKAIYQLGLTSDDLNKFADLADKSGTRYKPGTVYAGSDAGVDLRDIAAGGLGTRFNPFNDPYVASKGTGAVERQNEFQYYAGQLGLARNPAITGKTGYEIPSPQDIRPIYDREGKIQNYAVISGGGVRYFSSPAEAESQGYRNVIDLTGRAPMASYGQQAYRPGEKIISPTLPTINLRRLPGALPSTGPKGPGG